MSDLTAIVAGATGLVGGELVKQLLASDCYARVVVVARRSPDGAARRCKLQVVLADFDRLDAARGELRGDHVFCALGTTIRKAGSQVRFRAVDHGYPLAFARLTRANGAEHYSVVSALGASTSSPFFYSRVKGELERDLKAMDWPGLAIFRPSVIAGERGESRPFERLSENFLRFAPATWRPVAASDIAAAMIHVALRRTPGVTIVESRSIPKTARTST
jgi:uncharacterized protein YbjT (DUF2867 family)